MGCGQSHQLIYSVPVTNPDDCEGETPIYRSPIAKEGPLELFPEVPEIKTIKDLFLRTVEKNGSKEFLGTRKTKEDGSLGKFTWKTYDEVLQIVKEIGSGIQNLNLAPKIKEYQDLELQFVGVYSRNREEWLTLDLACSLYGYTMTPLYDTLGGEAIDFLFEQTNLTTMFCAESHLDALIKNTQEGRTNKLKNLVVFKNPKEEQLQAAKKAGLNVYTWVDIREAGKREIKEFADVQPESIFTFSYTSGTTGKPKGVMLTNRNIIALIVSVQIDPFYRTVADDVHLSYLPLAHVLERAYTYCLVESGASIGFFSGDIKKMQEDLQELRPTIFLSVPKILMRLYGKMKEGMDKLGGIQKKIAEHALDAKIENLHKKHGTTSHFIYDTAVFSKMKEALGGRVRYIVTGSAAISEEVVDFFKVAMSCPVYEGYGQTENCACAFVTFHNDSESGHVGGPLACAEFKLVDVPEMKYTAKDTDENGNLLPRGEICIRGPTIFKGYYKDPEKTSETVDSDGWLHSGDIGQINRNGSLKIIDRKKNIFKLAIGEYIAPEKIEQVISSIGLVDECWVHGDSSQDYLLAFIVPSKGELEKLGSGDFEDMCQDDEVIEKVLEQVTSACKAANLHSFEIPKKIYLEPKHFSDLDLLAPSMKVQRHVAKEHFKDEIEALFSGKEKEGGKKKSTSKKTEGEKSEGSEEKKTDDKEEKKTDDSEEKKDVKKNEEKVEKSDEKKDEQKDDKKEQSDDKKDDKSGEKEESVDI